MATYGKYPVDWSKEEMLRAAVPSYDIGMYEQNMLVWRLMNEPDIMAKVRSATRSVCAFWQRRGS